MLRWPFAQGETNLLRRKATYTETDRVRILELLTKLGLRDGEEGKLADLAGEP